MVVVAFVVGVITFSVSVVLTKKPEYVFRNIFGFGLWCVLLIILSVLIILGWEKNIESVPEQEYNEQAIEKTIIVLPV